jgi:hypothetical protein
MALGPFTWIKSQGNRKILVVSPSLEVLGAHLLPSRQFSSVSAAGISEVDVQLGKSFPKCSQLRECTFVDPV